MEDELPLPTADPLVDVVLGGLALREPADGELVTAIITLHMIFMYVAMNHLLCSSSDAGQPPSENKFAAT